MESRIILHAVGIERDDRNMAQICLVERTADKTDIIACPAAASGLRHHDGKLFCVIAAGQHSLHNLSHHRYGGKAGIVVDVA